MNEVEQFIQFLSEDYCKRAEATARDLENTSYDRILGHGSDLGGLFGALAFFDKRAIMFGYEIPGCVKQAYSEWKKKEKTGCPFCTLAENGTIDSFRYDHPNGLDEHIDIQIDESELLIRHEANGETLYTLRMPIKHCPFCGRELREGDVSQQ